MKDAIWTARPAGSCPARRSAHSILRMRYFTAQIDGETSDGLDIYRDLCRGRAVAFEEDCAGAAGMPSASGIGTLRLRPTDATS
jgi:hypothetical protein